MLNAGWMIPYWSDYISDANSFTRASTTSTTFLFIWFTLNAQRQPLLTQTCSNCDSVVAERDTPILRCAFHFEAVPHDKAEVG